MKNISFALTTPQFLAGTKSVTRRLGWKHTKAGDELCAVEKGQGLKKGEKVKKLGNIKVILAYQEKLGTMVDYPEYGAEECIREGFPEMTPQQFVEMFCKANDCRIYTDIMRIEFVKL